MMKALTFLLTSVTVMWIAGSQAQAWVSVRVGVPILPIVSPYYPVPVPPPVYYGPRPIYPYAPGPYYYGPGPRGPVGPGPAPRPGGHGGGGHGGGGHGGGGHGGGGGRR